MRTVRYTVANGEIIAEKRNGVRRTYVPDPLGSTVALLDNNQQKTDTFSYWPYGEVKDRTGTTPTPFQYVGTLGYYRDSTGRTYVRARHYQQRYGRWMTVDPSHFNISPHDSNLFSFLFDWLYLTKQTYPIGISSYNMCVNNPPSFIDTTGLFPFRYIPRVPRTWNKPNVYGGPPLPGNLPYFNPQDPKIRNAPGWDDQWLPPLSPKNQQRVQSSWNALQRAVVIYEYSLCIFSLIDCIRNRTKKSCHHFCHDCCAATSPIPFPISIITDRWCDPVCGFLITCVELAAESVQKAIEPIAKPALEAFPRSNEEWADNLYPGWRWR
jgi:RHS repeat-associated protein